MAPGVTAPRLWRGPGQARLAGSPLFPPTAKFAEEACALLTSSKFEACHHAVAPLPYLQNCHYDVCSCSNGKDCLCDAVANYADACARKGVHIAWREPSFCGGCPHCPPPPPRDPTESAADARNLTHLSFAKHCPCILALGDRPRASDKHGFWEWFICHFPSHLPAGHGAGRGAGTGSPIGRSGYSGLFQEGK